MRRSAVSLHPATFTGGSGNYTPTGSATNITSELDALTLNALDPDGRGQWRRGAELLLFDPSAPCGAETEQPAGRRVTSRIPRAELQRAPGLQPAIWEPDPRPPGYYDITADGAQGANG